MTDNLVYKLKCLMFSVRYCSRHKEELPVLSVGKLVQKDRMYSIIPILELALLRL